MVFDVVVVPAKGLVVEPGAMEPVTRRTTLAACPFLIGFGNRKGSMSLVVDPLSVVSVILVVWSRAGSNACVSIQVVDPGTKLTTVGRPSGPSGRAIKLEIAICSGVKGQSSVGT